MSTNKGYLIKYEEMNTNINTFIKQIDKWRLEIEDLEKEYMKLTNFDGIQGETADAIKDDVNKFSLVAIEHIDSIFDKLKEMLEKYQNNYLEIDSMFSVFSYEDFKSIEERLERSRDKISLITRRIEWNLSDISHLVSIDIPSSHNILGMHEETKYNIEKLKYEVGECEKLDSSYNDIKLELDVLINYLRSKDDEALKTSFGQIISISKGYYPDVKKEKKRSEKLFEVGTAVIDEVADTGTEPKVFRELGNVMNNISLKYGILGPEGPGQFIIPNSKHTKISNLFNVKAETLSRYTKNIKKVGKVFAIGDFLVSTIKDMKEGLGFEQAVTKNGLSTIGSVVTSKVFGGLTGAFLTALGAPVIFVVTATIATAVYGSYRGAKLGEAVYYHLIQNNIKGWIEVNEHIYDGIHPIYYPSSELNYSY